MTECRYGTCSNEVGQQDRDDYQSYRYCSIQCQVKHEHIKADVEHHDRDLEVDPGREP